MRKRERERERWLGEKRRERGDDSRGEKSTNTTGACTKHEHVEGR